MTSRMTVSLSVSLSQGRRFPCEECGWPELRWVALSRGGRFSGHVGPAERGWWHVNVPVHKHGHGQR